MRLRSTVEELLDAALPPRCPGCGRLGRLVCAACAARLARAPAAPPPPPLAWWAACYSYEGVARELVARAKYRSERRFLAAVAHEMARAVAAAPAPFDLVTWAPASTQRIRTQGVDHGELLARALARVTGTTVAAGLRRAAGPAQTGLDARTRRRGPDLVARSGLAGATVLVVDDVATTGGTLAAAARALHRVQAGSVFAVTIARTPRPGAAPRLPAYTPHAPADLGSPLLR